ncbi:spastin [Colletotrichum lupini]|uniref:Spastin n=1 Tax=Colletotrichum lupini TaxID=145971 RepID=A0A9Q8SK77_9PEZI|nr:spastin [Colletotrichum lupini]UQC78431.1 spastin [Colletotrichum lupini]
MASHFFYFFYWTLPQLSYMQEETKSRILRADHTGKLYEVKALPRRRLGRLSWEKISVDASSLRSFLETTSDIRSKNEEDDLRQCQQCDNSLYFRVLGIPNQAADETISSVPVLGERTPSQSPKVTPGVKEEPNLRNQQPNPQPDDELDGNRAPAGVKSERSSGEDNSLQSGHEISAESSDSTSCNFPTHRRTRETLTLRRCENNIAPNYQDIFIEGSIVKKLEQVTSLSLSRPKAFSCGVLKGNKVTSSILYGPPGTGKSMLARGMAKQSKFSMLSISTSEVWQKCHGEDEEMVEAIFSLARKMHPCFVFVDEADAMLGTRNAGERRHSRSMLNQFPMEWDGLVSDTKAPFVLLATNRPLNLGPGVLRRAPVQIHLSNPTREQRSGILGLLLKGETLQDINAGHLAKRQPLGNDLVGTCFEGAGSKVRSNLETGLGKVLFIDEAYRLASNSILHAEAIGELVDAMTQLRYQNNIAIILAGHTVEMERLLRINPGLRSRFTEQMAFPSLIPHACLKHLTQEVKKLKINIPETGGPNGEKLKTVERIFTKLGQTRGWASGRDVETLAKTVTCNVYKRAGRTEQRGATGALQVTWDEVIDAQKGMLAERRGPVGDKVEEPVMNIIVSLPTKSMRSTDGLLAKSIDIAGLLEHMLRCGHISFLPLIVNTKKRKQERHINNDSNDNHRDPDKPNSVTHSLCFYPTVHSWIPTNAAIPCQLQYQTPSHKTPNDKLTP